MHENLVYFKELTR